MGQNHSVEEDSPEIRAFTNSYAFVKKFTDSRFGEVKLLQERNTGTKVLQKEYTSHAKKDYQEYLQEFKKRVALNHPNLLKVFGYTTKREDSLCGNFFKVLFYFECFDYDLEQEINRRSGDKEKFPETELWYLLDSIVSAGAYFQTNKVELGNIRPCNILITPSIDYKIIDEGITGKRAMPNYFGAIQGIDSKSYLAPEIFKSIPKSKKPEISSYKADVFSLGMTLIEAANLEGFNSCYDWDKFIFDENQLALALEKVRMVYGNDLSEILTRMTHIAEDQRYDFLDLDRILNPSRAEIRARFIKKTEMIEKIEIIETVKVHEHHEHHEHIAKEKSSGAERHHVHESKPEPIVEIQTPVVEIQTPVAEIQTPVVEIQAPEVEIKQPVEVVAKEEVKEKSLIKEAVEEIFGKKPAEPVKEQVVITPTPQVTYQVTQPQPAYTTYMSNFDPNFYLQGYKAPTYEAPKYETYQYQPIITEYKFESPPVVIHEPKYEVISQVPAKEITYEIPHEIKQESIKKSAVVEPKHEIVNQVPSRDFKYEVITQPPIQEYKFDAVPQYRYEPISTTTYETIVNPPIREYIQQSPQEAKVEVVGQPAYQYNFEIPKTTIPQVQVQETYNQDDQGFRTRDMVKEKRNPGSTIRKAGVQRNRGTTNESQSPISNVQTVSIANVQPITVPNIQPVTMSNSQPIIVSNTQTITIPNVQPITITPIQPVTTNIEVINTTPQEAFDYKKYLAELNLKYGNITVEDNTKIEKKETTPIIYDYNSMDTDFKKFLEKLGIQENNGAFTTSVQKEEITKQAKSQNLLKVVRI